MFKVRRRARYDKLRVAGFLHSEAASLSSLHTLNYHEAREMILTRRKLQATFQKRAERQGWGAKKTKEEWQSSLYRWYRRHGYLKHQTDKRRKNEPWWQWFQNISDKLPPERRYTKFRRLRRIKRRTGGVPITERVQISKWINDLTRAMTRAPDMESKHQYKLQRERLRELIRAKT